MMKMNYYDIGYKENNELLYAVIVAKHDGKWIFVRHKDRETWEIPVGRREADEDINETAKRELFEETGAKTFELYPICIYSVEKDGKESFGQLFFTEVEILGELPDMEIDQIMLTHTLPDNLTYPQIQPHLYDRVIKHLDGVNK